jgi:hypothetical protein
MKFLYAIIAWLAMAAVISLGIVLAANGSPWLFILGLVGFVIAVGKIGCLH